MAQRLRFTVVVPTSGRPTLAATLATIPRERWLEVLIVADGEQPAAREIFRSCQRNSLWHLWETPPTNIYGNAQRDEGIRGAQGDRLVFMDDDDVFAPGSWDAIRLRDRQFPDKALMFRMVYHLYGGRYLWAEPVMREGNVGTPMFMPLRERGVGSWAEHDVKGAVSDFGFISQTAALQPVEWCEEVTCIIRPQ